MAFADWKKRTKSFSLLPEGYRAMAERVAQAAYKAGERDGRKQVEQIAAQGAELAVMVEREECAKVCDTDANRMESEAQHAIENGEHDEVSAIRSTAWKLSVAASRIRARANAGGNARP